MASLPNAKQKAQWRCGASQHSLPALELPNVSCFKKVNVLSKVAHHAVTLARARSDSIILLFNCLVHCKV